MSEKEEFRKHSAIFTYDLSQLDSVTKVRFVYVLKGRKAGDGLIKHLGGYFLVPGCFIVPISKAEEVESVFKLWKISYKKEEVLMR
jgi:hypothetical protein